MRFCLVHGFNVRDGGAGTVDRLAPFLRGEVDKDEADYGWLGPIGVRLKRKSITRRLVPAIDAADVVITHSNGAAYSADAMHMVPHSSPKIVINFSPALDRDAEIPDCVAEWHTFHTSGDFWVKLSRWLPFHPWGDQGAYGYQGDDPRAVSHNERPPIEDHSEWFDWAEKYAERCNEIAGV